MLCKVSAHASNVILIARGLLGKNVKVGLSSSAKLDWTGALSKRLY
jgi:hypothetical protein